MEGTSTPIASSLEIPPRTLGERVFALLPETVSGRLSSSYDREKIARRVLQELGTKERDEKALCDGIISAIYLDENIPRSIRMNLLKHMESVASARKSAQNDTLKYFKEVNEGMSKKVVKGSPQPDDKVAPANTADESVVLEGVLNTSMKGPSLANAHTNIDDAIDGQTLAVGADAGPGYGERLEQKKLIQRSKASKKSRTADSLPPVTDVNGGYLDKKNVGGNEEGISAEKLWDEDKIAEGLGVVGEPTPEIPVVDDIQTSKEMVGGNEGKKENVPEEEKTLEGDDSESKESLDDFRKRVSDLKNEASIARDTFFRYRHRNESRWRNLRRYFSSLRSAELPQSLVDERKVLESNWKYKLTLYKDARVALAKREATEGISGRKKGEIMAETIRELEFQNSIENYTAWKDVSWGDKKDSWALRALGRAKDWGEWYRKLDWKKRIAFSGLAVGVGVTGVVTGSAAVAGMGVAGSTLLRLLGSYSAGRGVYEFLEGYGNKRFVENKEEEVADIQGKEDLAFLDERARKYAEKIQENFERRVRGNRNRIIAGIGVGTLLFVGGTAWSLSHAMGMADQVTNGGSATEAVQKVADVKGVMDTPAGSGDSTEEMLRAAKQLTGENQVKGFPVSGMGAVEVAPSGSGTGGFASEAMGAGTLDDGVAAEVTRKIGESFVETATVPEDSSFEKLLIEKLVEHGVPKDAAGPEAHRAMLDLAKGSGKPFEIFNHVRPGGEVQYQVGSDGSLHVFGVTRRAGGEVIKRLAESGMGQEKFLEKTLPSGLPAVQESRDILSSSSLPDYVQTSTDDSGMASPDVFEKFLPPKVSVPSLEDAPKGDVLPEIVSPVSGVETASATPISQIPIESLDLSVPGSEYLRNIGTVVKERLTFLPLSQTQKDLIESIFSARIPVSGTEPTPSSVLFVRDTLGRALFSSQDVERWMQDDVEHIREKVNRAVYAGIVRIGGESLRIGKMIAEGESVENWLTKMARYILTHPVEFKK